MEVLTSEPTEIVAGDTVVWVRSFSDYPATSGWSLSYVLRNSTTKQEIDAAPDGSGFQVALDAATTASWNPGLYEWRAYISKDAERYTVAAGSLTVRPNFAGDGQVDPRTPNQRDLDAISAVLSGRASSDVQEYTVGGRQLKKMTIAELLKLQQVYAYRVARENGTAPSFMGAGFSG